VTGLVSDSRLRQIFYCRLASRLAGAALAATVALGAVGCRKLIEKVRADKEEPAAVEAEPLVSVPAEPAEPQPAAQQSKAEPGSAPPSAPVALPTPNPTPRTGSPGQRSLVPSPEPTSDQGPANPSPEPSDPPSSGDGQGRSLDLGGRVRRARTRTETPTGDVGDKRIRRQD
jgi:hypothetical protein